MINHRTAIDLAAMTLDFGIDDVQRSHLDDHLASCLACRTMALEMRRDAGALERLPGVRPPMWVGDALARQYRPAAWGSVTGAFGPGAVVAPVLFLLALLITATLVALVGQRPVFPASVRNGQIVDSFQTAADGPFVIHRRAPDGSLLAVMGQGNCPMFTQDGTHLSWTPGERTREVFMSGAAADSIVATGVRVLPGVEGSVQAVVSPDGDQVAWYKTTKQREEPAGGQVVPVVEIWVSPTDGRPGRRIVADGPVTVSPYIPPSWTPDGLAIAYATLEGVDVPGSFGHRATIRIVANDGSSNHLISGRAGAPFGLLTWSPDGQHLAFSAAFAPNQVPREAEPSALYVAHTDGSPETRIAALAAHMPMQQWAPDGGHIAYLGRDNEIVIISVVDGRPSGAPRREHTERPFGSVTWSPDSRKILGIAVDVLAEQVINSVTGTLVYLPSDLSSVGTTLAEGRFTCPPSWQRLAP